MLADRTFRLVIAVAAVAALSACGETTRTLPSSHATPREVGSVAPTVYPSPTKSVAPTESATAVPSATVTPTGGGGGGSAVTASSANKFEPATLDVKVGTEVTWTAQGFHTVTSGTAAGGAEAGGPLDGKPGFTTYKYKFTKAGTYNYFCQPHATLGMEGKIVVT